MKHKVYIYIFVCLLIENNCQQRMQESRMYLPLVLFALDFDSARYRTDTLGLSPVAKFIA
jgi:hypothetical protein